MLTGYTPKDGYSGLSSMDKVANRLEAHSHTLSRVPPMSHLHSDTPLSLSPLCPAPASVYFLHWVFTADMEVHQKHLKNQQTSQTLAQQDCLLLHIIKSEWWDGRRDGKNLLSSPLKEFCLSLPSPQPLPMTAFHPGAKATLTAR